MGNRWCCLPLSSWWPPAQHALCCFLPHPRRWGNRAQPCSLVAEEPCAARAFRSLEMHNVKALYNPTRCFSCRLIVASSSEPFGDAPHGHGTLVHADPCTVASPDLSSRTFHTGQNEPPWTFNWCFHVWFKEAPQHAVFMGIAFVCTRAGFRVPLG